MKKIIILVKQNKKIKYKARLYVIKNNKEIINCDAFIGKNGMTYNKKEGDKKTPIGIFKLGLAFGTHKKIDINKSINYIKLNKNLYWVDDVNSNNYNKLIDITKQKRDFNSAEHLIDYKKEYEYAIEIKSNPTNIKGKGSAIFLHCSNLKPTAGCIAIEKNNLKKILKLISKDTIIINM